MGWGQLARKSKTLKAKLALRGLVWPKNKKDQRTACGDRTHDQRIKSPTLCLTELRRRRYGGQANRSWFICVSRNHERERRKNGITQLNKKRIARRGFALIKVTRSKLWNSQFFLRAHQSMSPSKRKKKSRGGKKETCDFVTFALCDFSVHSTRKEKQKKTPTLPAARFAKIGTPLSDNLARSGPRLWRGRGSQVLNLAPLDRFLRKTTL